MSARFYPTPSTCTYTIHRPNKVSDNHGGDAYVVDDMYRVDFQRRISHQPIYGYDDTKFSFVAQGKELVTGNMIINFRYPGYLRNLLLAVSIGAQQERKQYLERIENATTRLDDKFAEGNIDYLADQIENAETSSEKLKALSNYMVLNRKNNPSQQIASSFAPDGQFDQASFLSTQGAAVYKAAPTKSILAVVEALQDRFVRKYSIDDEEFRSISVSSPLDIPVNQMTFDMSVKYGNNNNANFIRIFKDCYITGEEETVSASAGVGNDLSSSAQPILEVYPFFCRTIVTKEL